MGNTGQTLLVLGSLVLFSLVLPSLNQTILYNDRTLVATNAEMTAISLAQKFLAEAGTKAFDTACVGAEPTSPSQLTSPFSLGPGMGETYPNFNDLDDFDGLAITDSITFPSVPFNITAVVNYVNPLSPTTVVAFQTWTKRMQVTVTSPWLINPASGTNVTITMEQVYAYYN